MEFTGVSEPLYSILDLDDEIKERIEGFYALIYNDPVHHFPSDTLAEGDRIPQNLKNSVNEIWELSSLFSYYKTHGSENVVMQFSDIHMPSLDMQELQSSREI